MTTTKTCGQVLIKSFYTMEELMAAYRAICERPVHEGCEIEVSMSDWYGDPYCRDIRMSMRFMGAPVLLEEGDGWVARGVLSKPDFDHDVKKPSDQDYADGVPDCLGESLEHPWDCGDFDNEEPDYVLEDRACRGWGPSVSDYDID